MKYPLLFGATAVGWLALAIMRGGWWWIAAWPALAFALVATAYGGAGVRVFAKSQSGKLAWPAVVVLLPFLLMTWGVWHLQHRRDRNRLAEVEPGLWIGRRPLACDVPEGATVVDLTAEFPVARGVYATERYVSRPMLDHSVPTPTEFDTLVRDLISRSGTLYVHCAQGHGRSAMVTAAILLARGRASSIDEAMQRIRKVRPRVRLGPSQERLLDAWWKQYNETKMTQPA
jgi:protein-tyrosine phosphatase